MAKITAICNQKGGVGKTLTAVSLGVGLARMGKKVLLVDVDAQGSLTASLGYQHPDQIETTLATLLELLITDKPVFPGAGIIHHEEGIDLLPANIELSGLEVTLVNTMSRETVLREYLNSVRDQYDAILLDCCPSLGMLTINALAAADDVLVPMQAHYLSLKGFEQLIRTISNVKRKINPSCTANDVIQQFMKLLEENGRQEQAADLSSLLWYMDGIFEYQQAKKYNRFYFSTKQVKCLSAACKAGSFL